MIKDTHGAVALPFDNRHTTRRVKQKQALRRIHGGHVGFPTRRQTTAEWLGRLAAEVTVSVLVVGIGYIGACAAFQLPLWPIIP